MEHVKLMIRRTMDNYVIYHNYVVFLGFPMAMLCHSPLRACMMPSMALFTSSRCSGVISPSTSAVHRHFPLVKCPSLGYTECHRVYYIFRHSHFGMYHSVSWCIGITPSIVHWPLFLADLSSCETKSGYSNPKPTA